MHPSAKFAITLTLILLLSGLGLADYYLADGTFTADVTTQESEGEAGGTEDATMMVDETGEVILDENQTGSTLPIPAGAVGKNQGQTIEQVATNQGLEVRPSDDLNLLSQVVRSDQEITSVILLKDGDRAGAVAWMESTDTKATFGLLKEALIKAFSPQMTDLRDETMQEPNLPIRNILTFLDPALSEERILFVRVRDRLFEFHLAAGQEATMYAFVDSITK